MSRRVSVRGVVVHEGRILCVRLKPYHAAIKGEFWCTPGGGLDEGEALVAGLKREMVEETGVMPQVGELLYVQQFMFNDTDCVEFFFHVTNAADYLTIDLTKTSHGGAEIEEIAFVDPLTTNIRPVFFTTEGLADKIANPSSSVQIFSYPARAA